LFGGQELGGDRERMQEEAVNLPGEGKTDCKCDRHGDHADDQPGAQFHQVVEQRRAGSLDLGLVVVRG
jgi:hypothetical protein